MIVVLAVKESPSAERIRRDGRPAFLSQRHGSRPHPRRRGLLRAAALAVGRLRPHSPTPGQLTTTVSAPRPQQYGYGSPAARDLEKEMEREKGSPHTLIPRPCAPFDGDIRSLELLPPLSIYHLITTQISNLPESVPA